MLPALVSVAFAAVLALTLGGAGALLTRPLWAGRSHLAAAWGAATVAAASLVTFVAFWIDPKVGIATALALTGGAVAVHIRLRVWRYVVAALPLVSLALGVLLASLSLAYLWTAIDGTFYLGAVRFLAGSLPPDNAIPFFFAERLASGESTHALLDGWNGSDRPPLQSGFILIVLAITGPFAHSEGFAFGPSVVAQLLWVPGAYAFLRALGSPRAAALAGVALAAAMGSTVFNTVYTWPKLLSAGLVLASAAFLLDARRHPRFFRRSFATAVALFAFAMLAHGAAAFTIPLLGALGVAAYRRQTRRSILIGTGVGALAGAVVYLPWLLYQRMADPPGDRLLKWHLAGVIAPDDRSFPAALIDSYAALTPGEWLAGRWSNLVVAFGGDPLHIARCWCLDDLVRRRSDEFFFTTSALGWVLPVLAIILIVIIIRSARGRSLDRADLQLLVIVASAVVCMVFWCVLMFIPGTTVVHQGSHVWLLALSAVPAVWLWARRPWLAGTLIALQLATTLLVYAPLADGGAVDPLAVTGIAVGILTSAAAIAVTARAQRRLRRPRLAEPTAASRL